MPQARPNRSSSPLVVHSSSAVREFYPRGVGGVPKQTPKVQALAAS